MFIMIHQTIDSKCKGKYKIVKSTYLKNNLSGNQLHRCNLPPNHRLACSLISQQRCHPRAGHDSPRNKEQASLHIAKDTHNIAKPTQLGLSGHQQDSQANMVRFIRPTIDQPSNTIGFIRPSKSQGRPNSKPVSPLQNWGHLHQNQSDF